jgi:hypothetical protein
MPLSEHLLIYIELEMTAIVLYIHVITYNYCIERLLGHYGCANELPATRSGVGYYKECVTQ